MNKKKIIIITSMVAALLAIIALILGVVFIISAKDTINTQKASFSVNEKTIMWIAKQGKVFFGDSAKLAIAGIALSIIVLFVISFVWIFAGVRSKIKKTRSSGTSGTIAMTTIAAVAAVGAVSVLSVSSFKFKKSSNMENAITYFEKNAESISENKEDAAKAALIYTLANKEGISTFASASTLQLSLAAILFGDMYLNKISKKTTYEDLFKTTEIQKDFKALNAKVKFKNPTTYKEIKSEDWFIVARDQITIADSTKHAANVLLNLDGWSEILNGDYPAIHKMIEGLMKKDSAINPLVWAQLPGETKKIITELKYTDIHGKVLSAKIFEFMKKLTPVALKFERRVVGTLGKLLNLPYDTIENKTKTRMTVLEWLNTIVNSIDYISKDGPFESITNVDSTTRDGDLFKPVITSQEPQNVYGGTYHKDGTISIDFPKDKPVGTVGDSMYDIKLKLMQKVLEDLKGDSMNKKIIERQKTITPSSFIKHILESKGLKQLTDQYAVFNSNYDKNDVYGENGEAKHITSVANKIKKFTE